jgi:hypothetical protein
MQIFDYKEEKLLGFEPPRPSKDILKWDIKSPFIFFF